MTVSAKPGPIWPSGSDDCTVGFSIPDSSPIWVRLPTREYARLAAAAPELLANLKFAVTLLSALPAMSGTAQVEAMRAAIAKAEAHPAPAEGAEDR